MLGEKLKELRKTKGVTQQEVADFLGTERSSIAKYESNKIKPEYSNLLKLSQYFSISVSELFDETKQNLNSDIDKDMGKTLDEIKDVLSNRCEGLMFHGQPLTDEQAQAILNAIEMGELYAKSKAKEKFTPRKLRKNS